MSEMSILEQKYKHAPISWAILDVIQDFLEDKKGNSFFVTIEEIKNEIIDCEFEPGLPELHQILAKTDHDFVRYVFESVKSELQDEGFTFFQIDSGKWKITKPQKRA